jgi:hypothetical protein
LLDSSLHETDLALVLATLALTFIEGTGNWLRRLAWNPDFSFWFSILLDLPIWAGFAVLVPLVARVCRRWPLGRERTLAHLPAHAARWCCSPRPHRRRRPGLRPLLPCRPADARLAPEEQTLFYCAVEFIIYWAIVGIVHALALPRRGAPGRARGRAARERPGRGAARGAAGPARAALPVQHAERDLDAGGQARPRRRHSHVGRLGELLRATLDTRRAHEIPLAEELALLEPYLDIQKTRFGERVEVALDVAPGTENALVPTLLLQPLVENALQHGVERIPGAAGSRSSRGARMGSSCSR